MHGDIVKIAFMTQIPRIHVHLPDLELEHVDLGMQDAQDVVLYGDFRALVELSTARVWPMRRMRLTRCSIRMGSQGSS